MQCRSRTRLFLLRRFDMKLFLPLSSTRGTDGVDVLLFLSDVYYSCSMLQLTAGAAGKTHGPSLSPPLHYRPPHHTGYIKQPKLTINPTNTTLWSVSQLLQGITEWKIRVWKDGGAKYQQFPSPWNHILSGALCGLNSMVPFAIISTPKRLRLKPQFRGIQSVDQLDPIQCQLSISYSDPLKVSDDVSHPTRSSPNARQVGRKGPRIKMMLQPMPMMVTIDRSFEQLCGVRFFVAREIRTWIWT